MRSTERYLPDLLNKLRWVIPVLMAWVGVGYILFEHFLVIPGQIAQVHILRQAIIIGTLGPILAWLLLTWATAIARSHQQAEEALQRRARQMQALHDISLEITSRLDSDRVLAVVLEQAIDLLNAQGGSIGVYDPATKLIRKVAHSDAEYQAVVLRAGEGVTGQVVLTGQPLVVNDLQHWEKRSPIYKDARYDAILSVPLFWQGEVFGTLSVLSCGERRPFNDDDVKLMSLFADLVSIALKNSELFTQVVQLSQNLEQKVAQRTDELVKTQEALAQKAGQLQRLLGVTVRVQEEERTRIAQDLHDGLNQLITASLYELQAAQECIRGQRAQEALEKLAVAKGLLRTIEAENRRIIYGLRPPVLDTQGLVPALKWYFKTLQEYYGIAGSVQVSGDSPRLSSELETTLFRIVQESLNNVAVHAQAQTVQLKVVFKPASLQIVVRDNGIGFDEKRVLAAAPGQMGLIGMKERAQSVGGRIEVQSAPGQGTWVTLDVPLSPELRPELMVSEG